MGTSRANEPMSRKVLALIAEQGASGATDAEGARALQMHPVTYARRRGDLTKAGLVVEAKTRDGQTVKRLGPSPRPGIVWVESKWTANTKGQQ